MSMLCYIKELKVLLRLGNYVLFNNKNLNFGHYYFKFEITYELQLIDY